MAAHQSWSERIKSSRPTPWWRTKRAHRTLACAAGGVVAIAIVAAGINALLASGDSHRRARPLVTRTSAMELVEAGEIESSDVTPVYTRMQGEVVWLAEEGTTVAEGDPVMRLDATDIRSRLEEQKRQIVPRRTELERARQELETVEAVGRLQVRRAEVKLARAQWELDELEARPSRDEKAAARLELRVALLARERAKRDLARTTELVSRGMATNAELRQRKLSHLDAEANAHLAQLRLENVMRGPTELEIEAARLKIEQARLAVEEAGALSEADRIISEQGVEVARLRLERSESHIERHEEELGNCTIKAPAAGRLAFVDVWKGSAQSSPIRVGETVRWGRMIAKVADPGRMRAVVVVNEVDALRLVPGMKAKVGLTAYPGSRIPGVVSRVAARAVDKNEKLGHLALRKAGKAGVNVVEVHVDLKERPETLRGGHTATVSIDLASPPEPVEEPQKPEEGEEDEPPVAAREEGDGDA